MSLISVIFSRIAGWVFLSFAIFQNCLRSVDVILTSSSSFVFIRRTLHNCFRTRRCFLNRLLGFVRPRLCILNLLEGAALCALPFCQYICNTHSDSEIVFKNKSEVCKPTATRISYSVDTQMRLQKAYLDKADFTKPAPILNKSVKCVHADFAKSAQIL